MRCATRCSVPQSRRISGENHRPRLKDLRFKVCEMLGMDRTCTNSPALRCKLSTGVALFAPRPKGPSNRRRMIQNNQVEIRCAISETVQFFAAISSKHLEK